MLVKLEIIKISIEFASPEELKKQFPKQQIRSVKAVCGDTLCALALSPFLGAKSRRTCRTALDPGWQTLRRQPRSLAPEPLRALQRRKTNSMSSSSVFPLRFREAEAKQYVDWKTGRELEKLATYMKQNLAFLHSLHQCRTSMSRWFSTMPASLSQACHPWQPVAGNMLPGLMHGCYQASLSSTLWRRTSPTSIAI